MQQNFRNKHQCRAELVGNAFGRVKVPGIKTKDFLIFDRIAHVKFVRSDDVAFAANSKELALDGIKMVLGIELFGEDPVERLLQPQTGRQTIHRRVLEAVGDPHIRDRRGAQGLAHRRSDFARCDAMLDPEIADSLFRVRERKAIGGQRMRKAGRVEVHSHAFRFRPIDPRLEVLRANVIALDFFAAEFAVEGMQVEAMLAGNQ